MIETPTKPRVIMETRRDDYAITFILRNRRSWQKLSPEDRKVALLQGADALDVLAQQMRAEAIGEDAPALNLM